MLDILAIILPVFVVVAFGYFASKFNYVSHDGIKVLTYYSQTFAIPCLLFLAVSKLDLSKVFDLKLLVSFYSGAIICFFLGILGARTIFKRRPGESVALGFGALFSNSVLLGLPIMERAYGVDAMGPNFAIVSIHSIICYSLGVTVMELSRADGRALGLTIIEVIKSLAKNPLVIGLILGFGANILSHSSYGLDLPLVLTDGLALLAKSGLPVALFALGGVLAYYGVKANISEAMMIIMLSLLLHPLIVFTLSHLVFNLPNEFTRSAVITASMAPGVNTYIFANLYQRAVQSAASIVFLGTLISIFSISFWLWLLTFLLK